MKIIIDIPEFNNHEHNRVRRQQKFYSLPKRYKQILLNSNSQGSLLETSNLFVSLR